MDFLSWLGLISERLTDERTAEKWADSLPPVQEARVKAYIPHVVNRKYHWSTTLSVKPQKEGALPREIRYFNVHWHLREDGIIIQKELTHDMRRPINCASWCPGCKEKLLAPNIHDHWMKEAIDDILGQMFLTSEETIKESVFQKLAELNEEWVFLEFGVSVSKTIESKKISGARVHFLTVLFYLSRRSNTKDRQVMTLTVTKHVRAGVTMSRSVVFTTKERSWKNIQPFHERHDKAVLDRFGNPVLSNDQLLVESGQTGRRLITPTTQGWGWTI